MKKKISQVNFICDNCNEESGSRPERSYSEDLGGFVNKNPFPYEDHWIYIYDLSLKVLGKKINIKDKHFCNRACLGHFIYLLIDNVCEEEDENVHN